MDEVEGVVGEFRARAAELGRLYRECAKLTATGTAERRRVSVTVNADGIAIDVRFGTGIGDLSYDEIAAAVTRASREAVAEVTRLESELMAPMSAGMDTVPTPESIADFGAAVASLRDELR